MILELTSYNQTEWQPLIQAIKESGTTCHPVPGKNILVVNNEIESGILEPFEKIISKKITIDTPYQLASIKARKETIIDVNGVNIGHGYFNMIAGPCSVESEEQIFGIARFLKEKNIKFIRGGAYKPRTSPYSFRGLGAEGLSMINQASKENDLRVVTEILDLQMLDEVYNHADILQVGSRNMQNFHLLHELGKIDKPILLKRGMHAKTKEWLLAAEYILAQGNEKVILCERGIRSFDPDTRNVMDVGIIPLIRELSHLPIIADPSHGTGASQRVIPLSMASLVAGADGLIIEIHPEPAKALSDSKQALDYQTFEMLLDKINPLISLSGLISDTSVLKLQSL